MYILNVVSYKSLAKTLFELWTSGKPNLQHYQMLSFPTHVLKAMIAKMESRIELWIFVGYPKGTKRYFFSSSSYNNVFVSTHATFLEDDYMKNFKTKSKILLKEILGEESSRQLSQGETKELPKKNDIPPEKSIMKGALF